MARAGGFAVTHSGLRRALVITWPPLVVCAALATAIAASVVLATPTRADDDPRPHRVTYTVTTDHPTRVDISYRDIDPPSWAEYSHNPYLFSPKVDVHLEAGTAWVLDTNLDDPGQWAMVAVAVAGQTQQASPRVSCQLAVDTVVVDRAEGLSGAQCSVRHW
jgi:hypothetical protein